MMENNAPGRGKLKVTGIIYTVLGALSILGSLLILGAGGLLLASDNDVGLVLGAAAGVFSVLGAVSLPGDRHPGHPKLRPAGELRGQLCAWGDCAGAGGDRAGGQCGRVRPHRCGVQCGGTGAVHPLPPGRQAESGRMESGPIMKPLHGKPCARLGTRFFFPRGEALIFWGKVGTIL